MHDEGKLGDEDAKQYTARCATRVYNAVQKTMDRERCPNTDAAGIGKRVNL